MSTSSESTEISIFTRFLWWIAGAESSFLWKYPTEYSKFSTIGMVISMTCVVACVSGFWAAFYFSDNTYPSILFGLFWGFVIICIDRALVVTMKKKLYGSTRMDKFLENAKILIPRFILAILVAFLMSIPLELLIFDDLIQQELPSYEQTTKARVSQTGYAGDERNREQSRNTNLRDDRTKAEKARDELGEDVDYLEKEINGIKNEITSKRNQLNNPKTSVYTAANEKVNKLRHQLSGMSDDDPQRSGINSEINNQRGIMNREKEAWNKKINNEIKELEARLPSKLQDFEKKKNDLEVKKKNVDILNTQVQQSDEKIGDLSAEIDEGAARIGEAIGKSNKFIKYYNVLEYVIYAKHPEVITDAEGKETTEMVYSNPQALWLLWLIRVIFLVFEMMPTIVKAVSKPGPYEYAVDAHEQSVRDYLQSDEYRKNSLMQMQAATMHENQLATDRRAAEKDLHDKLLAKIRDAQEEIATKAIEAWRKEQLVSIAQDHRNEVSDVSVQQRKPQKQTISPPTQPSDSETPDPDGFFTPIRPDEWD